MSCGAKFMVNLDCVVAIVELEDQQGCALGLSISDHATVTVTESYEEIKTLMEGGHK